MQQIWILIFTVTSQHQMTAVAAFTTQAACISTAKIEDKAANQTSDTGRHFGCEDFTLSTEVGLDCEPLVSETCLIRLGNKMITVPKEYKGSPPK
jgi:hypothetical protein